jgi:hypothetical protein
MSNGYRNTSPVVQDLVANVPAIRPDTYQANEQRLAHARNVLDAMVVANEAGRVRYEQECAQLLAKAQSAAIQEQAAAKERREAE